MLEAADFIILQLKIRIIVDVFIAKRSDKR